MSQICEMLQKGATYIFDEEMQVPYLVDGDQWVGFDDERSIRHKMKWIKSNGFGGAMVWTVDMDDFTGKICGGDVKYPLIGAMREELLGIPRENNAKDIDWTKVANTIIEEEEPVKPEAIKIPVSELLNKHKKPTKTKIIQNVANKNGNIVVLCVHSVTWIVFQSVIPKYCVTSLAGRRSDRALENSRLKISIPIYAHISSMLLQL